MLVPLPIFDSSDPRTSVPMKNGRGLSSLYLLSPHTPITGPFPSFQSDHELRLNSSCLELPKETWPVQQ